MRYAPTWFTMKSLGMFRAVSVALTVSMAIMLSGCGDSSSASSQQSGQHATQAGNTVVRTIVKTKQHEIPQHSIMKFGYNIRKPSEGVNIGDSYGVMGVIKHMTRHD